MQPRKSLRFVDLAFIGLLFAWLLPVWYEKVSTQAPPEWKPVLATVLSATGRMHRRYSHVEVEYKFTAANGRHYTNTMNSLGVIVPESKALSELQSKNTLLVYYSVDDPTQSTSPEVGNIFAEIVGWNYSITTFLLGFIKLGLNGMGAMNGTRRPAGKEVPGVW